jgi:hypothetical protein
MKRTKLTLKEVYQGCYELWSWLAKNPTEKKKDWPGWDQYREIDSNCFACDYVTEEGNAYVDCLACPLAELWAKYNSDKPTCFCADSPYLRWCCNYKDISAAQEIADFCKSKLEEDLGLANPKLE